MTAPQLRELSTVLAAVEEMLARDAPVIAAAAQELHQLSDRHDQTVERLREMARCYRHHLEAIERLRDAGLLLADTEVDLRIADLAEP